MAVEIIILLSIILPESEVEELMLCVGDGLKYAFEWFTSESMFAKFEKLLLDPKIVEILAPLELPNLIESHPLHQKFQQKTMTLYLGVNLNCEK